MGEEQEAVLELSIWSLMKGIICTNKNILHLSIYLSSKHSGQQLWIYNICSTVYILYILYVRIFAQKCKSGTV